MVDARRGLVPFCDAATHRSRRALLLERGGRRDAQTARPRESHMLSYNSLARCMGRGSTCEASTSAIESEAADPSDGTSAAPSGGCEHRRPDRSPPAHDGN